jgi:endonuclease/exonuclease/phosphatase (EEP) superfamily protein YafD
MRPVRFVGAFVALVVLAGSVVLTLARLLNSEAEAWVLAASFVPWAFVGYLVALVLLGLVNLSQPWGKVRVVLTAALCVCVVGIGLHAWWLAPSYVGDHAPDRPNLTVLELNMLKGGADPSDTADLLGRERPDLLVLTEVTPAALAALEGEKAVGPGSRLPHVVGEALPGASGVVVASRSPLRVERRVALAHRGYVVRVEAARPYAVLAVHTAQPAIDIVAWRRDHATLVREERRLRGPHLVVGDLNATLDHPSLRTMLADGMSDAAQEANSGWQPTWPSPEKDRLKGVPVPVGMFAIDHVLLSSGFSAISTSAPVVRGSDHRALVARLVRR